MNSTSNSAVGLEDVVKATNFPFNIFKFKEYDGMKLAAMFIFLLALYSFIIVLMPNKHWWDHIPFINWVSQNFSFIWHFLFLTISYCFLWITFDTKGFLGYAMGVFTIIFGLLYIASSLDFAPDVIPGFGSLDDAVIGGLSIGLGASSWFQASQQDKNFHRALKALQEGNQKEALKLLLQDRGVEMK